METINQTEQQSQQNQQNQQIYPTLAIHIEGDKSGFVSKSAIDKFKNGIKSNPEYNLEELISKYIKPEFKLIQISKSDTEIKFNIALKPVEKVKPDISEERKKIRNKLNKKLYTSTRTETKETKYIVGQEKSSDMINNVMKLIQEKRPLHRIIDITDDLNPETYVEYQKANYFTNIAMIAERKPSNENVFIPRTNSDKSNVMVMSQGSFRTFNYELANLVLDSVVEIIKNH